MLFYILGYTFFASILSLFLVAFFLLYQNYLKRLAFHLVSFAAGALLATGLTDTLPEAVERNSDIFIYLTVFIVLFFITEKIFLQLHHHEAEEGQIVKIPVSFLLFGDALHNFIDGISIASTFLVSIPLGITTSIAVFAHEIPHELGDFGILLNMKYKKMKIFTFNLLTGLAALIGAVLGYTLASKIEGLLPILLALTSANFIYLSLSDLLPEIHHKAKGKKAVTETVFFVVGVLFVLILGKILKE